MTQPVLLLSHPMLAPMQGALEASGYAVHRLWDEPGPAALGEVRAIVHAGEVVLETALIESLPNLGLIACVSVGYDGVDVPAARARGIEVTHSQGTNAEDVADHALGLVISAWRGIVAGDAMVREGRWTLADRMAPRPSLGGKRAGIVGLGAIGAAVARRLEALGMTLAWWAPRDKAAPWPRAESLLALARESEVLVVACRADAANRGMISAEVIEALGPRGLLVNVARGQLVDEDALISALKEGRLGRAALDVFATEPTPAVRWVDVPNVVLTPHSAGGTLESIPRMVGQALENLRAFFAGEPVVTPVREQGRAGSSGPPPRP